MHVTRAGNADRPPVLLLHGAGVAGWMWRPVLARLRAVSAWVPDLPGHGLSAAEPFRGQDTTVDELAGLLTQPTVVVGFSWGAQLAVELTARHPDRVAGSVIVSGLARPLAAAPLLDPLIAATLPLARTTWFARLQGRSMGVPDALIAEYVATSRGADPGSLARVIAANNRYPIPPGWGAGRTPALLVHGGREPAAVRASARALQASRPGAELSVIAGAKHDIPFRAPDWLAGRIQSLVSA